MSGTKSEKDVSEKEGRRHCLNMTVMKLWFHHPYLGLRALASPGRTTHPIPESALLCLVVTVLHGNKSLLPVATWLPTHSVHRLPALPRASHFVMSPLSCITASLSTAIRPSLIPCISQRNSLLPLTAFLSIGHGCFFLLVWKLSMLWN